MLKARKKGYWKIPLKLDEVVHKIKRANDPSKTLSLTARGLLYIFIDELKNKDVLLCNHEDISWLTRCGYQQNNRLLNQLKDVFNINFHRAIKVNGKKYRDHFVITKSIHANEIIRDNPPICGDNTTIATDTSTINNRRVNPMIPLSMTLNMRGRV